MGILIPDVFTKVPGSSGGGGLSLVRQQGMHVRREDWRQGPALWKLWLTARCFPIAEPTWVDVCGRSSEVGAPVVHLELD